MTYITEYAKAWLAYLNVYGNELKEFGFEKSKKMRD